MAAGDGLLSTAALYCRRYCPSGMCNPDNVYTTPDDDAFALDLGEHDSGTFRIVFAERLRCFENRHRASEAAKGLRQFKTGRPCADDDEMFRPLGKIKNAFIRQIGAAVEAGNFRQRRFRSGRNHEAAGTDLEIAGNDCIAVLEPRLRMDDANPEPGETFG